MDKSYHHNVEEKAKLQQNICYYFIYRIDILKTCKIVYA